MSSASGRQNPPDALTLGPTGGMAPRPLFLPSCFKWPSAAYVPENKPLGIIGARFYGPGALLLP